MSLWKADAAHAQRAALSAAAARAKVAVEAVASAATKAAAARKDYRCRIREPNVRPSVLVR